MKLSRKQKKDAVILLFILIGMALIGYRMRLIEEAERKADEAADEYFRQLENK